MLRVRAEVSGGGAQQSNMSDAINRGVAAAQSAAQKAQQTLSQGQPIKIPMPNVNVDLSALVTYNFVAQLALTGISWATVFATSHAALMGKGAVKAVAGSPATAVLLIGVLIAAYSAYQSYTYLLRVKKDGLNVLSGGDMVGQFFDHATLNFVGCGCALVALFAEVGSLVVGTVAAGAAAAVKKGGAEAGGRLAIEALAQASATTILAHVVSLAFLFALIKKVNEQVRLRVLIFFWFFRFFSTLSGKKRQARGSTRQRLTLFHRPRFFLFPPPPSTNQTPTPDEHTLLQSPHRAASSWSGPTTCARPCLAWLERREATTFFLIDRNDGRGFRLQLSRRRRQPHTNLPPRTTTTFNN